MARNVLNVYPISDIDGIAASQTPNAGNLTINGALADNGTVQFASSHLIIIASSGDDSSRSFTIEGKDSRGISMIETISGANAGNAVPTNYFKAVSSISINGSNISLGGTVVTPDNNTTYTNTSVKKLAECFATIGWNTKLSELTESQMIGLIFILQEARSITYGHKDIENLELEHVKWSGGHWPPSAGIPF